MRISLIAAVARNGVIGREGDLPWRLPGDLRFFKDMTRHKPVVMGRKTWQSLPRRPLPDRLNLVVTREDGFSAPGAVCTKDIEEALAIGAIWAKSEAVAEIMVIGGGQIYQASLPLAHRLYLTEIDCAFVGDTHFPDLTPADWDRTVLAEHPAEGQSPAYRIVQLDRIGIVPNLLCSQYLDFIQARSQAHF